MRILGALFISLFLLTVAKAEVPQQAYQYKRLLVRSAHYSDWGFDTPLADIAGQVHAESAWNPNAKSWVGAAGLAQFMPSTSKWFTSLKGYATNAPYSPTWALRAVCDYDFWLFSSTSANTECDRMAFTLSAYNGGQGWVNKDKKLAKSLGLDPNNYWTSVSTVNAGRSASNIKENRAYPEKILKQFAPMYVADQWGTSLCGQ